MVKKNTPQITPLPEPVYDTSEIAANAQRLFGYSVDIARAAFDCGNVKRCSLNEAKHIIQSFAERKV